MTGIAHLRLDDSRASEGRRVAHLVSPESTHEIWYETPDRPLSTASSADPFLAASILHWMQLGRDVHVHGSISRTLLYGLTEWQQAWSRWRPGRYHRIDITVDDVRTDDRKTESAIAAFSGGVDAAYTVHRHAMGADGWLTAPLHAALLVHGFDIPLNDPAAFDRAAARARRMLGGLEVELLVIRTNLRELPVLWGDTFAAAIASALHMFAPEYSIGLIGSSDPYERLVLPYGSNPVTDPLLSSGLMAIRHDGAGASRTEKLSYLSSWREASEYLRVCWQGEKLGGNCGQCEKCQRTLLNFELAGIHEPRCFEDADTSPRAVTFEGVGTEWKALAAEARALGRTDVARRADQVIARTRRRRLMKQLHPRHAIREVQRLVMHNRRSPL